MREVRVGVRISPEELTLFGDEEVNELIAAGWRVVSVQKGGASFRRLDVPSQPGTTAMTLSGCDVRVIPEPPASSR